jgi:hypothetical protein
MIPLPVQFFPGLIESLQHVFRLAKILLRNIAMDVPQKKNGLPPVNIIKS